MKTSLLPFNIEVVENKYNAKFVGDFPIKTKHGWGSPSAVFYQANPDIDKGHSHLFGFVMTLSDEAVVFDASYLDGHTFYGVKVGDEYVWSRYSHDFRDVPGGALDGGFDYLRVIGSVKDIVELQIVNGVVTEVVTL